MKVAHRYWPVRAIAFILKGLALLILILCLAGAIFGATLIGRTVPGASFLPAWIGTGTVIASLLTGVLWFVPLFALGSVLSLLLDIEENTRALAAYPAAEALQEQPQP